MNSHYIRAGLIIANGMVTIVVVEEEVIGSMWLFGAEHFVCSKPTVFVPAHTEGFYLMYIGTCDSDKSLWIMACEKI